MTPHRFVVLADKVAVFAAGEELTQAAAHALGEQFREVIPEWRVIVLSGPSEVVDLRGETDLAALANELHEQMLETVT